MQVDWITVSAQVVNFLILVWLLKRFLYRPVTQAMDRREREIAGRIEQAEAREHEAGEQAEQYRQRRERLERERQSLLEQAREEVARQRGSWLEEARREVSESRESWHAELDGEREQFLREMKSQVAETATAMARHALEELADEELEGRMVQRLTAALEQLEPGRREALRRAGGTVRITSAFELGTGQRSRLSRAVHEHLDEQAEVEYAEQPELLCGIALHRGGLRLDWNLDEYLDSLAERVRAAFPSTGGRAAGD